MAAQPVRVVVWATGWIGRIAIEAINRRPGLELVGAWVHSADKAGRDAGDVAGIGPIGVATVATRDEVLALSPDCVCYCGPDATIAPHTFDDYEAFLGAGIDVVTVSTPGLVAPEAYADGVVDRLRTAALDGGASLYASGIEPGFAGDHLPLTLLTMSDTVRSVRTTEYFSYADYGVTFMMFDVFGFGRPLDHEPIMAMPGIQAGTWAPPVRMVASVLGVELDRIDETYEREVTDVALDVAAGHIPAGTVGAVRMQTIGVVDDRPAIVIEHVNRMADHLAREWWPADVRDGTYRIDIDGTPSLRNDLTLGTADTASEQGMWATAMRIVNAIEPLHVAAPGLHSSMTLPLTVPASPFRPF